MATSGIDAYVERRAILNLKVTGQRKFNRGWLAGCVLKTAKWIVQRLGFKCEIEAVIGNEKEE